MARTFSPHSSTTTCSSLPNPAWSLVLATPWSPLLPASKGPSASSPLTWTTTSISSRATFSRTRSLLALPEIEVRHLRWGDDHQGIGKVDVVFGSEILYLRDLHQALLANTAAAHAQRLGCIFHL
ncbi:hypothetical protein DL89DRAFT_103235 [Linderina pennispora]|uniref:Uncharacterized protein n=1 Tax=Linderina pennispora TaxID=61395 RepID=A0A1Y1WEH8_9FUNG|nr:uncharacterized protein DL89DRAFT_103235 [Linderina pennispora]ORX71893.1 hypothetical protein DL89DRAFT_103235 [Linderina pennispora]